MRDPVDSISARKRGDSECLGLLDSNVRCCSLVAVLENTTFSTMDSIEFRLLGNDARATTF
eukprot:COSAG02_NODE_1025_length_15146_cov_21.959460_2_plen_61_part_00